MPRKGENIYKRKDGRWEARYILHYENGKANYHSVYGKTYTEVREKRREALLKPAFFQASAVKRLAAIDEICRLWLISRKPGIKESTYTRYVRIVDRYILKYIGGCLYPITDSVWFYKEKQRVKRACTRPIRCSLFYSVVLCHEFSHQPCPETEALQEPIALGQSYQLIVSFRKLRYFFFLPLIRKALA